MEDFASGTKKRVLPSWMTAQAMENRKVPMQTPKRKRTAAVATARPTGRTVYCMNETELVDVALGILIEGRKQEKAGELLGADKPEGSPSPSPHTSSGSSSEEEDDAPGPGLSPPNTAAGRRPEKEGKEEEEDVLKYVREIFFS